MLSLAIIGAAIFYGLPGSVAVVAGFFAGFILHQTK
jgi:uncharacterized oligopeptide transporter (OPT) family protein